MGLIRKMTSVSTLGLVDFRSDKERIARNTKRTTKAIREQTQAMQAISAQQVAQQNAALGAAAQMITTGVSSAISTQTSQQIAAMRMPSAPPPPFSPPPPFAQPSALPPPHQIEASGANMRALPVSPRPGQWQPDPLGVRRLRWHDGRSWTDHTAD
jgi:hypothetical protein